MIFNDSYLFLHFLIIILCLGSTLSWEYIRTLKTFLEAVAQQQAILVLSLALK